jgi:hypothetical protein
MAIRLRQEGLNWHVAGDEVVVLDLDGSTYFKANGSGALLWQLLTEPRTEDELRDALIERYGIDEARAARDATGFVDDLRRRGMLAKG